jgi:hypothetical protein
MKIQLLYITILSILLIPACKQDPSSYCPSYSTNYQTLSASTINQTPYFTNKAFDTLSFASDKGDTVAFVKTKTDTSWYCEDDNSNPNCPKKNANCYQILHNLYKIINGNGNFDIKLSSQTATSVNSLDITFNDRLYRGISNSAIGVKNLDCYIGDKVINGKTYKNVTMLGFTNSNIFLNNNYGLLKVEYFNDNINWVYYEK